MDTYGKCGDLTAARDIFNQLKVQSKPSISSMSTCEAFDVCTIDERTFVSVNVYGINSQALEAVALYYRTREKLTGNIQSILISVLTACAHGGLVTEAQKIFDDIPEDKRSVKIWNALVSRRVHLLSR